MRLIVSLPAILVAALWLLPLSWPLWAKAIGLLVLLVFSQFHGLSRLSSGSVFAPEFPRPVVMLFNWGFAAIPILLILQLALILGAAAISVAHGEWSAIPDRARYAAAAAAFLLSAVGVWQGARVPPLRDVTIAIPGLAPAFDGYRLLHLTDLHLSRLFPASWARAVVKRANAAAADLIVITGDFIDGSIAMRRADVAPLADLVAPDGIVAIPGNHDYFFEHRNWMRLLTGLGLHMLFNRHIVISRDGAQLVLAGVTDKSAPGHGEDGPDLDAALRGAPDGTPIILLDHQPGDARAASRRGIALQLSGHTHGGMAPGLDRLVARPNDGFVSGRYDVGGMTLLVGNGTGIWPGFAFRLGRPSEIVRITLRPGH